MKGAVQSDFVYHQHLCDQWSGRTGSSLATAGRPLDKLPDEVRNDFEQAATDRAKKGRNGT